MVRFIKFKKAYIVLIVLLFLGSKSMFGQGYKLGVFFNPTLTWLQSDDKDVVPGNIRMGFDFGMSLDYFFTENYAFASGLSMFNTGGTLNYKNRTDRFRVRDESEEVFLSQNCDVKYNIQYVKIPAGLKFKTHLIGRMVFSANLGIDVMFRTSSSADFIDINKIHHDKINANKEINSLNLGWHFGGAASYHLGGEAAIYGGLSFMDTFTDITTPARDMITSQNLFLRIGFMF